MNKNFLLLKIREAVKALPALFAHLSPSSRFTLYEPTEYKTTGYMQSVIEGLIQGVYNNLVGGEFIDAMANILSGQITQAYQQAYMDQGYLDALPDYLNNAIETQILGQYTYVDRLFRDIIDARIDGTSIQPLITRAGFWANQWQIGYDKATMLILAEGGGNMMWQEGDTKEKCGVCVGLDGHVMSAKEWAQLGIAPKDPKLPCHGYNCDCRLVPTTQRRSPDAYGYAEEILLRG